MTSSNGNIFRVTGHLCGEFTGPRWIPHAKASDAELWCFLWSAAERLSKQWWCWWFETPSGPLWCHCNVWGKSLHVIMSWYLHGYMFDICIHGSHHHHSLNGCIIYLYTCMYLKSEPPFWEEFSFIRHTVFLFHDNYMWILSLAFLLTYMDFTRWTSKYIRHKRWDAFTYPIPNFKGATVEVCEWKSNISKYFNGHVLTYPCWDWS